jgi:hypothetical protein
VVRKHKEEVEALLFEHVSGLLPSSPEQAGSVARHLAFLLEGAMARAGLEGNDRCLQEARQIAAALIGAL